ncbi:MAG: hypothetical protein U0350_22520 [Caldilineaceae bacterium]
MSEPKQQTETVIAKLKSYSLFAELLEHYLCQRQMLPAHLAERIFVEPATISHWRKNKRLPDNLGIIHQVCVALALAPPERENLVVAWCNTRLVRDLIPYVEEATKAGDGEHALRVVKIMIGNPPSSSLRAKEEL